MKFMYMAFLDDNYDWCCLQVAIMLSKGTTSYLLTMGIQIKLLSMPEFGEGRATFSKLRKSYGIRFKTA